MMTIRTMTMALGLSLCLGLAAQPTQAEVETLASSKSVAQTMDALVAAVEGAGATVFARVNHGAGAASVDMALGDAELLIFGNPKLGTPVMQMDPLAGLHLPLKVLVYEDAAGAVWLAYEAPQATFDGLDVQADAPVFGMMAGALGKLTAKAAE